MFMTLYDFVIGRDKFGQTPYNFAKDKESRNEFRKFMGQYPDRYDYKTAQVSGRISHIYKTSFCSCDRRQKSANVKNQKVQAKVKYFVFILLTYMY